MIEFVDFDIIEDPEFVNAKYCINARFVKNKGAFDKAFSLSGDSLKDLCSRTGWQATCVMCVEDPENTDLLSRLFEEGR